ncbi:MAG: dethiobiotin synthase [Rubripirellula sp.]|nr:dethiobiotin synthase [Rubripirellula sp.]
MIHRKPPKLFFAGTDTDVGKTYVASLAVRLLRSTGRRVGVYKPVASGCRMEQNRLVADDAVALWTAAGKPLTLDAVCPQRFLAPLAPPAAAAAEQKQVNDRELVNGLEKWSEGFDLVIVEGAGGLFSPLANGTLNIDLVQRFNASLVIVAANRVGAIHQTLSTCEAASKRGVQPLGIVLCDPTGAADGSTNSNASQIEQYCSVPILGSIPFNGTEDDAAFLKGLSDCIVSD